MRPCGEASSPPGLRSLRSKSRRRPGSSTRTRSCQTGEPFLRIELAHGEVGAQGLAVLGERHLELGRDGTLLGAGVAPRGEAPAQHLLGEGTEVRQPGDGAFLRIENSFLDALAQQSLPLRIAAVEDRAGAHQGRS